MERIREIQYLIEEALDKFYWLEVYNTKPYRPKWPKSSNLQTHPKLPGLPRRLKDESTEGDDELDYPFGNGKVELTDDILKSAKKVLQYNKMTYINNAGTPNKEMDYLRTEIFKTETLLNLDVFSCYSSDRKERKDVLVEDIRNELPEGRIYGFEMECCLSSFLAQCWYFQWLKERLDNMQDEEPNPVVTPRLIWNGQQNTLPDVFRQLRELDAPNGQKYLVASNEDLAVFLRNNFDCFKDIQIGTIVQYFTKVEKRPQKAKSKITLKKG